MRILIINPFGIGDVLFSTPLISNLKAADPKGYIGYICNIRAKDTIYNNPGLNEIFVFEKDEYRNLWKQSRVKCIKKFIAFLFKIKSGHFDVAIDLSLGHQYGLFLWLIGIRKRIGYNYKNRGRFLTERINIEGYNDRPIPDYYLNLLKFLDIQPGLFPMTMGVSVEDREWADQFCRTNNLGKDDLIVGIIPAGGASWGKDFSYRHWPWQNYTRIADRLSSELGAKIVLFGDASEQNICRNMQDAMRADPINACGETTLRQFAALLAKCKLVVCNDGGPLHVAVSQDVTTVSIFGPVDEKVYGPYPAGREHIIVTKNIDCRPCYRRFKLPDCPHNRQCIKDISAEEVFKIIRDNLAGK